MRFIIINFIIISLTTSCSKWHYEKRINNSSFVGLSERHSTVFISTTEVTNKQFRAFLASNNGDEYMYDSTKWFIDVVPKQSRLLNKTYHWHPAFDEFPVVNVDLRSAKAYCHWLTEKARVKSKNNATNRLPTTREMNDLINQFMPDIFGNNHNDYDCKFVDNFAYLNAHNTEINHPVDGAMNTIYVKTFSQGKFYSILGNVSEICEDGSILGGNWTTLPMDADKPIEYMIPDPRVGFRVVMEITN